MGGHNASRKAQLAIRLPARLFRENENNTASQEDTPSGITIMKRLGTHIDNKIAEAYAKFLGNREHPVSPEIDAPRKIVILNDYLQKAVKHIYGKLDESTRHDPDVMRAYFAINNRIQEKISSLMGAVVPTPRGAKQEEEVSNKVSPEEEHVQRREASRRRWNDTAGDWVPLQADELPEPAPEPENRQVRATTNLARLPHATRKDWSNITKELEGIKTPAGTLGQARLSPELQKLVEGQPISEMIYRLNAQKHISDDEVLRLLQEKLSHDQQEYIVNQKKELKKEKLSTKDIEENLSNDVIFFDIGSILDHFETELSDIKSYEERETFERLSEPERVAIVYYTHNGDEVINKHLRQMMGHIEKWHQEKDPIERQRLADALSAHLSQPNVQKNARLVQLLMDALAKLPQYRGAVYRGAGPDDTVSMGHGDVYYRPGFMSTTRGEPREIFWDKEHPGQMAIMSDRGADISSISWYPEEAEVLRPPGIMHWVDVRTPGLVFTPEDVKQEQAAQNAKKTLLGLVQVDIDRKPVKPLPTDTKPGDGAPMKEYYLESPRRKRHVKKSDIPGLDAIEKAIALALTGLGKEAKAGAKVAMTETAKPKPSKHPKKPAT